MMGLGSSVNLKVQKEGITEEQPNTTCSLESNVTPSGISQVNTRGDTSQSITTQSSSSSSEEDTESEGLQLRRSKCGKRHFEVEGKSCDFAMFAGDPTNAESAIGKEVWKKAMQEEINSIENNGTWKLVNLPEGKKAIGLKWILKTKLYSDGTIQRHKARLVAHGYVQEQDARKFRSLVGRLTYLTHTQPDLAYAVGLVSKGIWYVRKEKFELIGYCDSDWAGEKDDMKSTSGNCFMFGSGVVTWVSKEQATVALSSTEAEYISAATAACQAVRLRRVLEDLNQTQERASVIFCNNRSAVAMTRNPVLHARTKHININHYFIRELVAEHIVSVTSCRTNDQLADLFTMAHPRAKFKDFRDWLLITNFESGGM
nr:retrovirus-related Pol polyprotein from transposon TNT 1-94 [Tanacetum cinerariifolium]